MPGVEPLDFATRFGRLLQRVVQRAAVPFLGSGISVRAARNGGDPGDFKPTVRWMYQRLADAVEQALQTRPDAESLVLGSLLNDGFAAGENPAVKHVCGAGLSRCAMRREYRWKKLREGWAQIGLGRLAQAASWILTEEEVRAAIGLSGFRCLEPTPAHRYLAYLAREGLVTEIITTNYDTCLEEAFRRSFRPLHTGCADDCLAVVRNLEEYRRRGGLMSVWRASVERPNLKLYKINGCAAEGRLEIMLTEQQLHSLARQCWAEDLFCDRARTRSLVFSGFGSDEPQIRHAVLELLKEFATGADSAGEDEPRNRLHSTELPNAPWVAAYEASLSYSQLQVLYAFRKAHDPGTGGGVLELLAGCRDHAFTGEDASDFGADGSGGAKNCLEADLFWQRVFQCAFLALLWRYSDQGSGFSEWVQAAGGRGPVVGGQLLNWLDPDRVGLCLLREKPLPNVGEHRFGRFPWLLEEAQGAAAKETGGCDGTQAISCRLRLADWLLAMHPQEQSRAAEMADTHSSSDSEHRDNFYLPLREDPVFVLATLYTLFRLLTEFHKYEKEWPDKWIRPTRAEGLIVTIPGEASDRGRAVQFHLRKESEGISPTTLQTIRRSPRLAGPSGRFHRVIEVPGTKAGWQAGRVKQEMPDQSLLPGRYVRIPAQDLLKQPGSTLADVLKCFSEISGGYQTRARTVRD